MEIAVYNKEKKKVGEVSFSDAWGSKPKLALIHQAVTAQLWNRRHGTSKVKNRHEVAGSTRKIIRQKGTGGARHGDIKAPLFVGGGQAFGPKPRDYEVRLPQKIRGSALRSAFLQRNKEGRLLILDRASLSFEKPKTKLASQIFQALGVKGALVIVEKGMSGAEKSIRNLERFKVLRVEAMNVVDVLKYEHLIMTQGAYEQWVSQWEKLASKGSKS